MVRGAVVWMVVAGMLAGGAVWAQPSGHGVHPPRPDTQLFVTLQAPEVQPPIGKDVPLQLRSPFRAEALQQTIELPESLGALRAVQYLPAAQLEQSVAPGESAPGPGAIELAVEGPTQSFRRWLLADDPERNRLMSYIASWRYMTVADETQRNALFTQFETEFTRSPTLRVAALSGSTWREFVAEEGKAYVDDELGCTVSVKRFFPDYAIDPSTLSPSNQSQRRRNPAVLVEIQQRGTVEDRWVFSKFPEFSHAGGARLPVRIILDCAMETEGATPDFAMVTIGKSTHEVWTRTAGKATSTDLTKDHPVVVPGSSYVFRLTGFVPNARIVESYRPADKGKGRPAVEFEVSSGQSPPGRWWLELGQTRRLPTPGGAVWVGLQDHPTSIGKAHP